MIVKKLLHPEVAALISPRDCEVEQEFYNKLEEALYERYHNEQADRVQREDS